MSYTALITGASRGLGAGIAREFAQLGYNLALCSRSDPELDPCHSVITQRLDVRDGAALARFAERSVDQFGQIDLWVNNAGLLAPIKPLRDCDITQWWELMEVNVRALVQASQWFARHVRGRDGEGVLINISSGAAQHGYAGWTAYCASKAAVDLFSEALQLEERDAGLRVYSVAPGVIDTDMQNLIRSCDESDFPEVGKFHELKQSEAFNSTDFVARSLHELAWSARPREVVLRLPSEHA